jgi:lysophospholipase L1-like esterase
MSGILQALSSLGGAAPTVFVNFARPAHGATFTSSANFSAGFLPGNAFNDWRNVYGQWGNPSATNPGTSWATTTTGADWIEVDCGVPVSPTLINVIGINDSFDGTTDPTVNVTTNSSNALIDYKTQYFNGSIWVDINTVTGNNKIWKQFTGISGITAQRYRVLVSAIGGSGIVAIVSFEVWGNSPQTGPQILPVGDSLTAGTGLYTVPWPHDFGVDLPAWTVSGIGLSTSGITMNNINSSDWWKVQPLIDQRASRSVAHVWAGINDLGGGQPGATVFGFLSSYIGKIRGETVPIHVSPSEIWIATMLPQDFYAIPVETAAYDGLITANSLAADVIVDLHTLSTMQDPTDATKFLADEIHPTNLGGQLIANYIESLT